MLASTLDRIRSLTLHAVALAVIAVAPLPALAANITYTAQSTTVKGLRMTIFTNPVDTGGSLRITRAGGFLWFAERTTGTIMKLSTNGIGTPFQIPRSGAVVNAITRGPDGNLWFPLFNQPFIGRLKLNGNIAMFATHSAPLASNDIVAGPDGRLWFGTNALGVGRTTVGGDTTFFPVVTNSDQVSGITVGSDDRIWFVEWGQPSGAATPGIGKMKTNGFVNEIKVGFGTFSNSFGIAAGPDQRIWFADPAHHRIGRINLNGNGLTFFKAGLHGDPISIIAGPDGNLYFGETNGRIGRITTAGVITEYGIPGAAGTPNFPVLGLTVGPDGNIWFVNNAHAQVGKLRLAPP